MNMREEIGVMAEAKDQQQARRAQYLVAINDRLPPDAAVPNIEDDASAEIARMQSFDRDEFAGFGRFVRALIIVSLGLMALWAVLQ